MFKRYMIDWLSFTIEADFDTESNVVSTMNDLFRFGEEALEGDWSILMKRCKEFIPVKGRKPYGNGFRLDDGISVYYNTKLGNILFEVSGKGCDKLREWGILDTIVMRTADRMSRIDIAVDMETETSPIEFVSQGVERRFKARSSFVSKDGLTEYVGSRNSERYCRVYRYNEPHPRAKYLRAEFVFRKQNAKIMADKLITSNFDIQGLSMGCGVIYGFEHPDWQEEAQAVNIESYTPERRKSKTLIWMLTQVAPAFKKLVRDGVIENPVQFCIDHFVGEESEWI